MGISLGWVAQSLVIYWQNAKSIVVGKIQLHRRKMVFVQPQREVKPHKPRQKIAVFGEMKDLGKISNEAHTQLGQKIAKTRINFLITIGSTAKIIAKAAKRAKFPGRISTVANTNEAIREIKKIKNQKSLILVKGSRHAHLERIVLGLLHKSTRINCYHCGVLI